MCINSYTLIQSAVFVVVISVFTFLGFFVHPVRICHPQEGVPKISELCELGSLTFQRVLG